MKIVLDKRSILYENDDDEVDYFLRIPNGDAFAQYVAEFTTALESDIDSNDRLEDIEDEEIVLFGKTYTIVLAENNSGNHKLTLMGGLSERNHGRR